MSMRTGDRTKKAPKHQNSFAFRHNKNSRKTKIINNIPNHGLCKRCSEIIEWRKKYRKYKPIKNPAKCNKCGEKKVKFAYHKLCSGCSNAAKVCPKCSEPHVPTTDEEGSSISTAAAEKLLQGYKLQERHRRAILRALEKGALTGSQLKGYLDRGEVPDVGSLRDMSKQDDEDSGEDAEGEEEQEQEQEQEVTAVADQQGTEQVIEQEDDNVDQV